MMNKALAVLITVFLTSNGVQAQQNDENESNHTTPPNVQLKNGAPFKQNDLFFKASPPCPKDSNKNYQNIMFRFPAAGTPVQLGFTTNMVTCTRAGDKFKANSDSVSNA